MRKLLTRFNVPDVRLIRCIPNPCEELDYVLTANCIIERSAKNADTSRYAGTTERISKKISQKILSGIR
jgi:hypothetical protein